MDRLEDLDVRVKIAVVGAGWAGLAAAVELVDTGHDVTLFEAGRRPGGRARSAEIDGRLLDNGQHILLGAYRATLALMARVGVDPNTVLDRRPLQVSDNAGFHLALPSLPPPFNAAWGLLTARGVPWRERFATAMWMERLKRRRFRLTHDTTVATWLDASGQTGVLRRHLWEPLCVAALNTPAARASAQIFANVLRDSLGSSVPGDTDLLLPRTTLGQLLPEAVTAWLGTRGATLRFSHRVKEIAMDTNGVAIDGEPFATAIVAVAPQHLGCLVPQCTPNYAFEPIATVYLQYHSDVRLTYPLRGLQGGLGQWVVDRGDGLLAVVLSGHGPWETLADAELAGHLHGELEQIRPPQWFRIIREKRATFSCRPALTRADYRVGEHLFLAGDHVWSEYPGTLEGAVRSGLQAASACRAHE